MLIIRRNTFETNSSSTHSLCIPSTHPADYSEEELLKPYTVKILKDVEEEEYLISIQDKLNYLYTVYAQYNYRKGDEFLKEWEEHPLCINLHKLIPNLTFTSKIEHCYTFEDAEWFYTNDWDGKPGEWEVFRDIDKLKKFLLEGAIYFFNRDNKVVSDKYTYCMDKDELFCEWTG